MCWIARFSAFGDAASTHRALGQYPFRPNHLAESLALEKSLALENSVSRAAPDPLDQGLAAYEAIEALSLA